MFLFTSEQEFLLEKFILKNPEVIEIWRLDDSGKLGALIDIYGGHYPDIFSRNDPLTLKYSKILVDYCLERSLEIPSLKESNQVLKKAYEDYGMSQNGIKIPSEVLGQSDIYPVSQKNTVFLFEKKSRTNSFLEIKANLKIEKVHENSHFDIISNFDALDLAEVYRKADEVNQKNIALILLQLLSKEATPEEIIDVAIRFPFQHLVEEGYLTEIPKWVTHLRLDNIQVFSKGVLDRCFNGCILKFNDGTKKIKEELYQLFNDISQKKVINYIEKNPVIDTVYMLVNKNNLSMLNSIGKIIDSQKDYLHLQFFISERLINVHIFEKMYDEMTHYKKMEAVFEKNNFKTPELNFTQKFVDHNEKKKMKNSISRSSSSKYIENHLKFFSTNATQKKSSPSRTIKKRRPCNII